MPTRRADMSSVQSLPTTTACEGSTFMVATTCCQYAVLGLLKPQFSIVLMYSNVSEENPAHASLLYVASCGKMGLVVSRMRYPFSRRYTTLRWRGSLRLITSWTLSKVVA